jgi:ABC-type transport system involved in multi-copper enzyme maturation permease subunit
MIAEMKMLLWKDLRLSELCLLAGVMFIIDPYMFMFNPYAYWYDFNHAWVISTVISQLTMALVAGNIIACERADRSAAFLAFQGITRKKIITSKLIICFITFISIYVISFISIFWLDKLKFGERDVIVIIQLHASIFATGFCFIGCCWLLSDLITNSVAAIVFGLLPPGIIACGLSITSEYLHWPRNEAYPYWYTAFVAAAGLISLIAGTWHFIMSKES